MIQIGDHDSTPTDCLMFFLARLPTPNCNTDHWVSLTTWLFFLKGINKQREVKRKKKRVRQNKNKSKAEEPCGK